jgi:hypothetical protein
VQCDGYEAYDKLTKADRPEGPWTLVHCWTHARRRFVKRLKKDGSPIAVDGDHITVLEKRSDIGEHLAERSIKRFWVDHPEDLRERVVRRDRMPEPQEVSEKAFFCTAKRCHLSTGAGPAQH